MEPPDELQRWYDDHAQALFRFLLNYTRSEEDTHDLLQQLFEKLAAHPEFLGAARDERGYLLRLARNLAVDLIRRRTTQAKYQGQYEDQQARLFAPIDHADETVYERKIEEAMAGLPAEQRAIVHLKLWEEMTFEAIAETLDISPNTAASRYRYGIDKLRQCLRPYYEECAGELNPEK